MDQASLIAETNALLKQVLDADAARKAEAEKQRAEFETQMGGLKERTSARTGAPRKEAGAEDADSAGDPDEDWEKRLKDAREKSRERMEQSAVREREFKAQLLEELRTQTELLRQIAERVVR